MAEPASTGSGAPHPSLLHERFTARKRDVAPIVGICVPVIDLRRRHRPPARRAGADIGVVLLVGIAPIPETARHAGGKVKVGIRVNGCRIPIPVGADDPPPARASAMSAVPPVATAPTRRVEWLTDCVPAAPGVGTVATVSGARRRRLSDGAWTRRISAGLSYGTWAGALRIS